MSKNEIHDYVAYFRSLSKIRPGTVILIDNAPTQKKPKQAVTEVINLEPDDGI